LEREILKRILESDFETFVKYFFHIQNGLKFRWNEHHGQITDALLKCHRKECIRLVINIPPRYSKTELAVVMFIAWSLAKNPRAQFIHLSYSDELALDNSARVLELIQLDEYQELWPVSLKPDRKSKSLWRTAQGGGLKAGAAGGAVTGFGAGVPGDDFGGAIIIDDPLKPDDIYSEAIVSTTNRRLNATIKSRVNSRDTPIILIMQRLSDNDPAGFVLSGGTGEDWEHLKIPVIKEDGEPLWPFRHTMEDLVSIQVADKYVFNGQYMQEPIAEGGDYFTADNARWYKTLPNHLNFYGASDYAVTEGGGDYTEHGIFGIDPNGNVYIADWWSGQTKSDVWIESQLDLHDKYRTMLWAGETGPIKAAIEPWLKKRSRERHSYPVMRWLSHSQHKHKEVLARGFQGLWEHGRVYLPEGKEWAQDLLRQLTRFPLGSVDDKVDVCGLFARMMGEVWELSPPEKETAPEPVTDMPLRIEDFAPKPKVESEW
jgi:predicted phage terminase large subunit-like protein